MPQVTPKSPAPGAALQLRPGAQLLRRGPGQLVLALDDEMLELAGVPEAAARDLFELADGTLDRAALVARLADRHPEPLLRDLVDALLDVGALQRTPTALPAARVLVLGNHVLFEALARHLADNPLWGEGQGVVAEARVDLHRVAGEATSSSAAFAALRDAHVVLDAPETLAAGGAATGAPEAAAQGGEITPDQAEVLLRDHDCAVVALEGLPRQAALVLNRAALQTGTPCLFVTGSEAGVVLGPTVLGDSSACLACRWSADPLTPLPRLPAFAGDHPLAARAAEVCAAELRAVLDPAATPRWASGLLQLEPRGQRPLDLPGRPDCPACAARPVPAASAERALDASLAAAVAIGARWPDQPMTATAPSDTPYRSVGIVGGGTAGYLAALILRARRPELRVTLIESRDIPIIGVGEATTPELVKFLHSPRFLGRDVASFFERVRPTFKLGIRFLWGAPGAGFTFPFQRGRMLESLRYDGSLDHQSLGSLLMLSKHAPVFATAGGVPRSLLHQVRWAYHLDNARFVHFLRDEAAAAGVEHVDARIVHVERDDGGDGEPRVAALVSDDGRRFDFDLYVDCSGFRSLLMGDALGSPFVDYGRSLYTDRAVVAHVPHDGTVKPYTLAETMDNGWCWNIPFEDQDHRGYVYASSFTSDDQAVDEMRAANPDMGEPHIVRFRSGRREHFMRGNVVALGNAHGFVEPLESTALHMIVLELEVLASHFPESREDRSVAAILNRKLAARWDAVRWFLSIHYRFNRRLDTPFWRACRSDVDISGAEERLALFRERAPLSYRSSLFYTVLPPEFFSDDHSFDTLLMGQGVPAQYVQPADDAASWQRQRAALQRLDELALPQAQALAWLRGEGARALGDFQQREDSWLHSWLPA